MPDVLSPERMEELLAPFLCSPLPDFEPGIGVQRAVSLEPGEPVTSSVPADLLPQLAAYLDLLLRWNARTNLTAIRDPEGIVQRHFGESLFAGRLLSGRLACGATLLDFGSGAGLPGLPIQLLRPDLLVTLAESQGKKASFLREAVRTLGLTTEVFAARVEAMPASRRFDAATLRAVDHMELAVGLAAARVLSGGWLAALGDGMALRSFSPLLVPMPGRNQSFVEMTQL